MASGVHLSEVHPSTDFKYERISDYQVKEFLKFIFSVNAKKSQKKAVKQVGLIELASKVKKVRYWDTLGSIKRN